MTRFLLDSGNPEEYREIIKLAKSRNSEIWGGTTNPTLIAKTLSGRKFTQKQAFDLQKEIVLEILKMVPGAVSAEVYSDENTPAGDMIAQGEEIASWDKRVNVKLPTTIEGFRARTILREKNIQVNNTLVFSQEQIFAICLHEKIIRNRNKKTSESWPFISPFIGRLDDKGDNGMDLIKNGMKIKKLFDQNNKAVCWMLAASIRKTEHIKASIDFNSEIITAPGKIFREWFLMDEGQRKRVNVAEYTKNFKEIPYWRAPDELLRIDSIEDFMNAINEKRLDISHPLTTSGLQRFAEDWKAILV